MKLKEWMNDWLELYVKPTSKRRTYDRYLELTRLHIVPELGDYDVEELSSDILQKFVTGRLNSGNMLTGKGLASNTVCSIINVLQCSLKTAMSAGQTKTYVADRIRRPKRQEKEIECFTVEEQRRIEYEIKNGDKLKLFGIVICFYTGLRIGELLALEWSDVDLVKGVIVINRSCHDGKDEFGNYKKIKEPPKTKSSVRTIPLPRQMISLLKRMSRLRDCDFVISDNAQGVSVRSYQRSFDLLLKKLNISHRGFHAIRHTFATRALECGMDVKTLAEVLGHKSPTVTLNRYAHSRMDHKKEMMDRLGKFF